MIDYELFSSIQYVLMEPPDGGISMPSGLWTPEELRDRANERQNRFLKRTQILVGVAEIPATAGVFRYALPGDWLTTMSVVWRGSDAIVRELVRSDSFEADHGMQDWTVERDTPQLYMDEDSPLLTIQIAPAPLVDGTLEILYIPQGALLTGNGELLTVPDEYAHAIKYGTLADLFGKDGRGKNPEKAAYCERRFALAQEVAAIMLAGWA